MNAFFLFRYAGRTTVNNDSVNTASDAFVFSILMKPWEYFLAPENSTQDSAIYEPVFDAVNHYIHNDDFISASALLDSWKVQLNQSDEPNSIYTNLVNFYSIAADRLCRRVSIEIWEEMLEEFAWSSIPKTYHQDILLLAGYVYQQEDDKDVRRKCKQWLNQLLQDKKSVYHIFSIKYLMQYHANTQDPDSDFEWNKLFATLHEAEAGDATWNHILAVTKYNADLSSVLLKKTDSVDIISSMNELARGQNPSQVTQCTMLLNALLFIVPVFHALNDDFKALIPGIGQKIYDRLQKDVIPHIEDQGMLRRISVFQAFLQLIAHQNKEAIATLLDMLSYTKKQQCWRLYLRITQFMLKYMIQYEGNEKAYRFLKSQYEGFRIDKVIRMTEPSFHLLQHMNDLLLIEVRKPGISWAVPHIAEYFECHERFLLKLDEHRETSGKHLFNKYQKLCLLLPEVAVHHIRTSVSIHKLQFQVLLLALKYNQDRNAVDIGNQFIAAMQDGTSVLSLLNADWDDMKDVPFEIRNKLLNRSISITKGDLPLAAEHANFSYRNLRSYISLNEVNRLGFFLVEKATQSKRLETGIRLMFHDLYLSGNIFEAVFDMPAFLVKIAQTGFVSEDMEEMLNIKSSTAKKYIKIMCDIGIITPEKVQGRKLKYKLSVETIMNRYAEIKTIQK
jgi:hypothetical protein